MAFSDYKFSSMKPVQKFGLFLFIAALAAFVAVLGMSHYRLTATALRTAIPNKDHYTRLLPALQPMLDKEYSSKFSFIHDFRTAVNSVNDPFKKNRQWDKVIWTDYTFAATKNASAGILYEKLNIWFVLVFVMGVAGALLYIIPQYAHLPPGIKNNHLFFDALTSRGWLGIILGTFLIGFYICLYWYPEYITNWVILVDPLSRKLNGGPASQWFLYGFLYTLAVLVMGIRMMLKYRHNRYQIIRSASVMFFQTCIAFILPEVLVAFNKPWFDFKNIWPLNYSFFYDYNLNHLLSSGKLGIFMLVWGIALFVVAVPVFTYFFGKRWYCSWVCGCGGLAETLGDPFRQLSNKSLKAWKIERWMIHSVLVFAVVMTLVTLVNYLSHDQLLGSVTNLLHQWYGFFIGAIFSGIVGTGFYPLMGNRMWCRFGCPLAAYLGLVQRFKSRFRITTNGGQCISCGNCSTYCEMGIDVRWYAQRGQNIVRSSCVGCGICAAVCPRGVLKLENRPEQDRINDQPFLIGNKKVEALL